MSKKTSTSAAATTMRALASANWDRLEKNVVERIRLLRAVAKKIEKNELTDKIANDLILPAIRLLAQFCECVEAEEVQTDD